MLKSSKIQHGNVLLAAALMMASAGASADELNGADTAWILTSTALVLFMTIPGLSLFYAGLVRVKNVLSVLMQCFALTCLMSVLWFAVGYTIAFGSDGVEQGKYIGDFGNVFFGAMTRDSMKGTIPASLFAIFQMTFAIITPALIAGAFRRAYALFGHADLQRAVAGGGVFTGLPLGLGRWLAGSDGLAGLRRWYRGAYHRSGGSAGGGTGDGAAPGFWHRGHAAAQSDPDRRRRRYVVGRLVRL